MADAFSFQTATGTVDYHHHGVVALGTGASALVPRITDAAGTTVRWIGDESRSDTPAITLTSTSPATTTLKATYKVRITKVARPCRRRLCSTPTDRIGDSVDRHECAGWQRCGGYD